MQTAWINLRSGNNGKYKYQIKTRAVTEPAFQIKNGHIIFHEPFLPLRLRIEDLELLGRIACHYTPKEIDHDMKIGLRNVYRRHAKILDALRARSDDAAIKKAIRIGLIRFE